MEKIEKYVLLCGFMPDEANRLQNALKNQFNIVLLSSPDELLKHSGEKSLLLLNQEFLNIHTPSIVSDVLKKKELPAILHIDIQSSSGYPEILEELDVSHTIVKHDNYLPLLVYSINKAIADFYHQKKMGQALLQLKRKLDDTQKELEDTREKITERTPSTGKVDILEEIIFVFKRGEIELPAHPKLSFKFKQLIEKGASLQNIANLLMKDAAISSKLIAVSNSPFYRGISNNKTLEQAIGRLGLDTARQIVDVILNRSLYMAKKKAFVDIIEQLWEHALSCAYASQIIAQRLQLDLPDDAFTLGLLHDVGKLVLLQTIGELQKKNKLGENIDQSELFATINNYHCKFGASLLKLWKFSEGFIQIAAYHNNLSEADPISKSLILVNFANLLVNSMGYGLSKTVDIDFKEEQSTIFLKLKGEDIQEISGQVEARMDEFRDFFH